VHVLGRLSAGAGIQIVVRQLISGVDPAQVEMHVITARPLIAEDRLEELPATVHPLGHTRKGYRLVDRVKLQLAVARQVRRIRADVVHLHTGTSWMGVLARVVVPRAGFVLQVHDAPGSGHRGPLTDRAEGWWGRLGRATVVCHSSSVAAEIRQRWRPPEDRLVQFPLAVDTEVFHPRPVDVRTTWRRSMGIPDGQTLFLVAGRLAASKRFDRMVEVIAQLGADGHDVGLVIVGRGVEEPGLRALAVELGVEGRVWFTGRLEGQDLGEAFAAADVLCSPSEYEGFGLTLVEGMASGLPVLAVAVGGVTDLVVDGETGALVDAGRPGDLLVRAAELAPDRTLRSAWGAAGLRRAKELYGVDLFVRRFTELYRRVAP
jgi:glycosyltransferase involved in cell wall biosynthesis